MREEVRILTCEAYETIGQLVSNTYWDRAWIIQEVFLGRNPILWYGSTGQLSLENFCRIYRFIVNFNHFWGPTHNLVWKESTEFNVRRQVLQHVLNLKYRGHLELFFEGEAIFKDRMNFFRGDVWPDASADDARLSHLVEHASQTRCFDVRDKIYAFLNLALDREKYTIVIDYGKAPADLYFDFFIATNHRNAKWANPYAEALMRDLECTYVDLLLSARFRNTENTVSIATDPFALLKSRFSWVLQEYALGVPKSSSDYPVVLLGPVLESNPSGRGELRVFSVPYFMAALAAEGQGQKAPPLFRPLIDDLKVLDVSIIYRHPPVALYNLGRATDSPQIECTHQETTTLTVPKGITKCILDECLLWTPNLPYWQVKHNWAEIVQRSIRTAQDAP